MSTLVALPSRRLPYEVHCIIIHSLRGYRETLSSCALVCVAHRDIAQQMLFQSVVLRKPWADVMSFFSTAPKLASHVRQLAYVGDKVPDLPPTSYSRFELHVAVPPNFVMILLQTFPRVLKLHFFRVEVRSHYWWSSYHLSTSPPRLTLGPIKMAVVPLSTSPPLTHLSFNNCLIDVSSEEYGHCLLPYLPSLTTLETDCVFPLHHDLNKGLSLLGLADGDEDFDEIRADPDARDIEEYDGPVVMASSASVAPSLPSLTHYKVRGSVFWANIFPFISPHGSTLSTSLTTLSLDRIRCHTVREVFNALIPSCHATLRDIYIGVFDDNFDLLDVTSSIDGPATLTPLLTALFCARLGFHTSGRAFPSPYRNIGIFLQKFLALCTPSLEHCTVLFQLGDWSPSSSSVSPLKQICWTPIAQALRERGVSHSQLTCVLFDIDSCLLPVSQVLDDLGDFHPIVRVESYIIGHNRTISFVENKPCSACVVV